MQKETTMRARAYLAFLPLAAALLSGCGHEAPGTPASEPADAVQASTARTGAQLWADNCNRCHNYRPPTSFSDTQWEAVVTHMRLRANLTGVEQREITRFLQASH